MKIVTELGTINVDTPSLIAGLALATIVSKPKMCSAIIGVMLREWAEEKGRKGEQKDQAGGTEGTR